jgi:HAD superfamily hydrolase (TIGR01509 family)
MIHALVMELEGVVAESGEARRQALRAALAARGIAIGDDVLASVADGVPMADAARGALAATRAGADETEADLLALDAGRRFADAVASGAVPLAPGAAAFVRRAHEQARLAIVTRARRADVETLLAHAGLADAFAFVVAAEETPRAKPDPEGHLRAVRRLGARFEGRTLALEDAPAGIRAARAAGLPVVGVGALAAAARGETVAVIPSLDGESVPALAARLAAGERVA